MSTKFKIMTQFILLNRDRLYCWISNHTNFILLVIMAIYLRLHFLYTKTHFSFSQALNMETTLDIVERLAYVDLLFSSFYPSSEINIKMF